MLILFVICVLSIGFIVWAVYFYKNDMTDQADKLIQDGKYEMAIPILQKEILKKPNEAKPYLLLADSHFQQESYQEALGYYKKINENKLIHDQKGKTSLLYKIADTFFKLEEYDNVFDTCLQILKISPDDLKANKIIAFMLLGNAQFKLAIPYLETVIKLEPNDHSNESAYSVALYGLGEVNKAIELAKKQTQSNEQDINLSLLYLSMCAFHEKQAGIQHLIKIFPSVRDETIVIFLIRLYCFMIYNFKLNPSILDFLKQQINNTESSRNVQRECTYFLIFFLLQFRNTGEAERWIHTFEEAYGNYRELANVKASIGMAISESKEIIDFESIYQEEFQLLFPQDLVYRLSKLKTKHVINVNKFFQGTIENNQFVLNRSYQRKSLEALLEKFSGLTKQEFLEFAQKACGWLGLRVIHKKKHLDLQNIDYLCESREDQLKFLVSFKQFKQNTNLSDIFLTELLTKTFKNEIDKIILVTNGKLTEPAQGKLRSMQELDVLQGNDLHSLLQELLGDML